MNDQNTGLFDVDRDDLEYDDSTETYRFSFDPARMPAPSLTVTYIVALLRKEPFTSLPPITERIDTDGLDALLGERARTPDLEVTFTYSDFRLTVTATGDIEARSLRSEGSVP